MRAKNWHLAKNVLLYFDTVQLSTLKKKFRGFRLTGALICRTPINDGKACQLADSPALRAEMGFKTRWLAEKATLGLLVSSVNRVEAIKEGYGNSGLHKHRHLHIYM